MRTRFLFMSASPENSAATGVAGWDSALAKAHLRILCIPCSLCMLSIDGILMNFHILARDSLPGMEALGAEWIPPSRVALCIFCNLSYKTWSQAERQKATGDNSETSDAGDAGDGDAGDACW